VPPGTLTLTDSVVNANRLTASAGSPLQGGGVYTTNGLSRPLGDRRQQAGRLLRLLKPGGTGGRAAGRPSVSQNDVDASERARR
jgi:hypothetical protein